MISALIKQAIFYDWICFKKDKDNVNLIEPAVQIIFYSAKEYPDLTMELLEFLDCYSEYFDKNNKSPMFKPAITEKATRLGKICDCDLTEKGVIKGFITDNNEILEPKYIYLRKNFVYYSKTKLLNRNIYPKKIVTSLENIKVNIQSK